MNINPLCTGKPQMGTFTNGEDPDKMPQYATFHQGLHCWFFNLKQISRCKNTTLFLNYNLTPLDIYIGLFQVYCIKPEGTIH